MQYISTTISPICIRMSQRLRSEIKITGKTLLIHCTRCERGINDATANSLLHGRSASTVSVCYKINSRNQ